MAFKLPFIKSKHRPNKLAGINNFAFDELLDKDEIGRGGFGTVFTAKYKGETVVIKKILTLGAQEVKGFEKEVKLLSKLKHPNIAGFRAFSINPYSIMLDFEYFSFKPFNQDNRAYSLDGFLRFVNSIDEVQTFASIFPKIATDIASGLHYLHSMEIAHRDMKPGNVLVSNVHYSDTKGTAFEEIFQQAPIVCKLTDFGESRSNMVQTNTLLHSKTSHIDRGTVPYMAPEIMVPENSIADASFEELAKVDIWGFGMTLFNILNPDVLYPYELDIKRSKTSVGQAKDVIIDMLSRNALPSVSGKYEKLNATTWVDICDAFVRTTNFNASERPSSEEVYQLLTGSDINQNYQIFQVGVSQSTAFDVAQEKFNRNQRDSCGLFVRPENDATNACTFLSLLVALEITQKCPSNQVEWDGLAKEVNNIITTAPIILNKHRNDRPYSADEALKLMKASQLLPDNLYLTEEILTRFGPFSLRGRECLKKALHIEEGDFVGVYTCEPYSFVVGHVSGSYFAIDTHSVGEECMGDGNAIVIVFNSPHIEERLGAVSRWIWKRLGCGSTKSSSMQSFSRLKLTGKSDQNVHMVPLKQTTEVHSAHTEDDVEDTLSSHRKVELTAISGDVGHQSSSQEVLDVQTDHDKPMTKPQSPSREGGPHHQTEHANAQFHNEEQANRKPAIPSQNNGAEDNAEADASLCISKSMKRKCTHEQRKPANSLRKRCTEDNAPPKKSQRSFDAWTERNCTDEKNDPEFDEDIFVIGADGGVNDHNQSSNTFPSEGDHHSLKSFDDGPRQSDSDQIEDKNDPEFDEDIFVIGAVASINYHNQSSHTYLSEGNHHSLKSFDDGPRLSDSDQIEDKVNKKLYNDDHETPVFLKGKRTRCTTSEAVKFLLATPKKEKVCTRVPLKVRENLAFLVSTRHLEKLDDVKCDMNGVYSKLLRIGTWTVKLGEDKNDVTVVEKRKIELFNENQFHLHINSKQNSAGLVRSIFYLQNKESKIVNSLCLLQYHHNNSRVERLEFDVASHGNRKYGHKPFYPTQKSVIERIRDEIPSNPPSLIYANIIRDKGGVVSAHQPEELPRGKEQVYQVKKYLKTAKSGEELFAYVSHSEEPIVLQHHDIPEDLWVFGTRTMCTDLTRFCTSEVYSHPFSVDPTFNFGNFDVTPFTYRHLLLENKRSGVAPIFLGPTAIHHSKTQPMYRKIVSAVTDNCDRLKEGCKGYITDGEQALENALGEGLLHATPLRCFNHFRQNCKIKLRALSINTPLQQKPFLDAVFGVKEVRDGILDAEDSKDLKSRLYSLHDFFNEEEAKFLKAADTDRNKFESQFFDYLIKNRKMMAKSMSCKARLKAGMPCKDGVKPQRSYTNQSESMNNILRQQKNKVLGKTNTTRLSKLEFLRDVWTPVHEHQQNELRLAICGESQEMRLADCAKHLQLNVDDWFNMTSEQKNEYVTHFNRLSVEEVLSQRPISINLKPSDEKHIDFSFDLKTELVNTLNLNEHLATLISDEALKLLRNEQAVQNKPSLSGGLKKFLVAAKRSKVGHYECTNHKEHVSCTCPSFRYNSLCKHSIVVAEKIGLLRTHLDYVCTSPRFTNPSRQCLFEPPKETSGKKGGRHKNSWRPARKNPVSGVEENLIPSRPYTEIHHNDNPLIVVFLDEFPNAISCRQCGIAFPRKTKTVPFDIVLSHDEKWLYPDRSNPGNRIASTRFTTKYYCVKKSCVYLRFPYFDKSYLHISSEVKLRLTGSHLNLLNAEFQWSDV